MKELQKALCNCIQVRCENLDYRPEDIPVVIELDEQTFRLLDELIDSYAVCAAEARQCIRKAKVH